MKQPSNPQLELAHRFVNETNRHIFLTGKAGTGKTTFLHHLLKNSKKRAAVVAPTGVAAINARGVTIYSLFQLPFGPLIPGQKRDQSKEKKFRKSKINLLRSLDLLIIDEISMVRADVLDGIDETLQRYRRNDTPFGGVQLLMIGDLHQLPPVIKQEDWNILRPYYDSLYFFGSQALARTEMITIELKHIYRQSDPTFINLLNKIRNNEMDLSVIETLNSRYIPAPTTIPENTITLTSHVATAKSINENRLQEIQSKSHKFEAEIEGTFPPHSFPNDEELEFKNGAQVMFVKNDLSEEKLYYNGKLGYISNINGDEITVIDEEEQTIIVTPLTWENTKYELNPNTKLIEEEIIGTFTQMPLRLAWAITIHKSQGLTFDKVIIDAAAAFAHGQVYVALSRCKTFDGITLLSQIDANSVMTDRMIQSFEESASQNAPDENALLIAKKEFEQHLLRDLFDFKKMETSLRSLLRTIIESENVLHGGEKKMVVDVGEVIERNVYKVGLKFTPQLDKYFQNEALPSENQELIERLQKASVYFIDQLDTKISPALSAIPITTDNAEVRKKVKVRLDALKKEAHLKKACFQVCNQKFDVQAIVTANANADIDFDKITSTAKATQKSLVNIQHKELYEKLRKWRDDEAEATDIDPYMVAQVKSLIELTIVLPQSIESLKRVYGFGKKKIDKYGNEVVQIIKEYCKDQKLEGDLMTHASKKPRKERAEKGASQSLSISMYKNGMSIKEISTDRNLAPSTIESHLALGIRSGDLDIKSFIDDEKLNKAVAYFEGVEDKSFGIARGKLGDDFSYGELRMVTCYLEWVKVEEK